MNTFKGPRNILYLLSLHVKSIFITCVRYCIFLVRNRQPWLMLNGWIFPSLNILHSFRSGVNCPQIVRVFSLIKNLHLSLIIIDCMYHWIILFVFDIDFIVTTLFSLITAWTFADNCWCRVPSSFINCNFDLFCFLLVHYLCFTLLLLRWFFHKSCDFFAFLLLLSFDTFIQFKQDLVLFCCINCICILKCFS